MNIWNEITGKAEQERRANEERRKAEAARNNAENERRRREEQEREHQIKEENARYERQQVERQAKVEREALLREQKEKLAEINKKNKEQERRYQVEIMWNIMESHKEKESLIREHNAKEDLSRKEYEKQINKERNEADVRLNSLNSEFRINMESKHQELLKSKEQANDEKMKILEEKEKEKEAMHKAHLTHLDRQREDHEKQQAEKQKLFYMETENLKNQAAKRENDLKEEKRRAEIDFQKKMKESEKITREERAQMRKLHDDYMHEKDKAIADLRVDSARRINDLQEENKAQQQRDLATLKDIEEEMIQREKEHGEFLVQQAVEHRTKEGELWNKMIEEKQKNHGILFSLSMARQKDNLQYQQILAAIPRADAAQQQTNKLSDARVRMMEAISEIDHNIVQLEMDHAKFTKKQSHENQTAMEEASNMLNKSVEMLNKATTETRTEINACTAVLKESRDEWENLLRQILIQTSALTRSSTRLIIHARRKTTTKDDIEMFIAHFDKIKMLIVLLPSMKEKSVIDTIRQGQAAILASQKFDNQLTLQDSLQRLAIQSPSDPQ